jgi:hypothetical protein
MTGIVFSVLILVLLAFAIFRRRQEHKQFVQEDLEEENGKYWNPGAQEWTSERQKAEHKARQETFLMGTAVLLRKRVVAFAQIEYPHIREWNDTQMHRLNNEMEQLAEQVVRDVDRFKQQKNFEIVPTLEAASEVDERLKKRIMAFMYEENPRFANLDSKSFGKLNAGILSHSMAIIKVLDKK